MSTTEKLVRFGLENVYYALYDETANTYGNPVAWPGAVSLSLDPDGNKEVFYADNTKYVTLSDNNGYTGTLEMAADTDEIRIALLGELSNNGMIVETTSTNTIRFALLFEVEGNLREQRTVLYNCGLSRPSKSANTKNDSTSVDTVSYDFDASSIPATIDGTEYNIIKATVENSDDASAVYESFMSAVTIPGDTTA